MGIGAGLGFGGYFTKNLKNNSEQVRLIEEACDLGINVIDTAEIYAEGAAEETIGKTSQNVRNNLFIIFVVGISNLGNYGTVYRSTRFSQRAVSGQPFCARTYSGILLFKAKVY